MNTKMMTYNMGSQSAKDLSAALGIKRLKKEGRAVKATNIINWGCSGFYRAVEYAERILNHPDAVAQAVDKLKAFKAFRGVENLMAMPITPEWTESRQQASNWLAEGHTVVARQKLTGHSGDGIVIMEDLEDLVNAPLYTKYVKKQDEYRLHVFGDKVFFRQRKARKNDVPDDQVNWKVRNLDGGFIFANQNIECDPAWELNAVNAVKALGLDFGAVDLIVNKKGSYVLEVNTACGLAGTTLEKYAEVLREFV